MKKLMLGLVIASTALTSPAFAQRGERGHGGDRGQRGHATMQTVPAPQPQAQRQSAPQQRQWSRPERAERVQQPQQQNWQRQPRENRDRGMSPAPVEQSRQSRSRGYDHSGHRGMATVPPVRVHRDQRHQSSPRYDNRHYDNRRHDSHSRNWSRDWRRDNRYDWNRYRSSNRNVYRAGRYYAPYGHGNYRYNRLSVGIYLGSPYYASSYWINDPWSYRLPPVYGSYRWVRYYDDVLLVDTWTGEVVDVIYDFFW